MSHAAIIDADGVNAWYGSSHVLRGIDFRVPGVCHARTLCVWLGVIPALRAWRRVAFFLVVAA